MLSRNFLVCLWLLAAVILRKSSGAPIEPTPTDNTKTGGGSGGAKDPDPIPKTKPGDGSGGNPGPEDGVKKNNVDGSPLGKAADDNEDLGKGNDNTDKNQDANLINDPSLGSGDTLNTEQKDKPVLETRKPEKQPTDNPPVSGGDTDPGKQTETTDNETAITNIEGGGAGADPSLTDKPPVSDKILSNDTSKTETDKIVPEIKPAGEAPGPIETETPPKEKDEDIIKNKETKKPEGETTKITQKPEKTPKAGEHPKVTEKPKETKKVSTTTTEKTTSTSTTTEAITSTESANEEDLVIEPVQPKQKNKGDKGNQGEGEKVVKPADKEQKSQPVVSEDYTDEYEGGSSGHFMAYFLTATVLCVAGYVIFHNKQKIIAFIIEGRSTTGGRRPSSKSYQKLKTKVDDVMPSLEKSTTGSNYVY